MKRFHLTCLSWEYGTSTDNDRSGSDAAVKDLTFAILMSNNSDGSVSVNANWDNVEKTMKDWGYTFTKSAMK